MRLHGAYERAPEEFAAASARYTAIGTPHAAGFAQAERGDVLQLHGRYEEGEAADEEASSGGFEPQPGLALLWLARGRTGAARAAMVWLLAGTQISAHRTRLLPAAVEILLAAGDLEQARDAARELPDLAATFRCSALRAMAASAAGRLELERGDAARDAVPAQGDGAVVGVALPVRGRPRTGAGRAPAQRSVTPTRPPIRSTPGGFSTSWVSGRRWRS
jgi:hypothetical protein